MLEEVVDMLEMSSFRVESASLVLSRVIRLTVESRVSVICKIGAKRIF